VRESSESRHEIGDSRAARRLRLAVVVLAVAYPVALLGVLATLRGIGERAPLVTLALYLPRAGFGLPLPFLTLALLFVRPRRWLLTQALAALLLLFPLMGLSVRGARAPDARAAHLRVMSCNVDENARGEADLVAAIRAEDPDIVCLQEARGDELPVLARSLPGYVVRGDGQFIVASKHPIVDVYRPPVISRDGETQETTFVRYRILAPGGLLDLYNMHPVSPHVPFDHLRGVGLLHELATGRFFVNHDAFRRLGRNATIRGLEVRAVAEHAGASPYPVLIAGDTNLPSGSWLLGRLLGDYQDGFAEVGRGFGYTFPAHQRLAWLRLDRILADGHFRFVSFRRLDVHVSTHFPVVTDLERVSVPVDDKLTMGK
jgi:endonuclease/exonuclease/phosphatase (EEP) superfamily protein YafD